MLGLMGPRVLEILFKIAYCQGNANSITNTLSPFFYKNQAKEETFRNENI